MQAPAQIHRVAGASLLGLVIMALMLGPSPARAKENCPCFTKAEIISICKGMLNKRAGLLQSRGIYDPFFRLTKTSNAQHRQARRAGYTDVKKLKCKLGWKSAQRNSRYLSNISRFAEWRTWTWASKKNRRCAKDSAGWKGSFLQKEEGRLSRAQQDACRAHISSALSELRR